MSSTAAQLGTLERGGDLGFPADATATRVIVGVDDSGPGLAALAAAARLARCTVRN